MSDYLLSHGLQYTRLPCPSPSTGICSNSSPLSWWWHLSISYSVAPFFSYHQSIPVSGSFPMNWLFASGGQSIRDSVQHQSFQWIQGWFLLGLTGLISLQSKGLSRVFSSTIVRRHQFFGVQPSLWSTLTSVYDYRKNNSFDYADLCQQSDVSASEYVVYVCHSFPPKEQVSFNCMAAVIVHSDFRAPQNKICHYSHFSSIYLPWSNYAVN